MAYANPFGTPETFKDWLNLLGGNPIGYEGYRADPQALYGAYSDIVGSKGPNAFGDWLRNQYGRYYGQYNTLAATDPTYQFWDYLKTLNPSKDYSFTNPYERGTRTGDFTPTMRMVT